MANVLVMETKPWANTSCRSGRRMCGTCKKDVAERIERFLREHQQAREAAREMLPEFGIKP